jgi:hypothetical protein
MRIVSISPQVAAILSIVLFIALLSGSAAMAAPTVLDFEDLPAGTTIMAQYGSRGVLFQNAYLDTDSAAHSGTQVLRSFPPNSEVFTAQPFVITFTSAQTRVKLFAGWAFAPINGTLTAFDEGGNVVAQDGPKLVAENAFTTMFEVTGVTPSITRVELQYENSAYIAIDDLEFEGAPPAQVPTTPPVVQILSPATGVDRDLNQIDITGTVTGAGLLSPVTITMSSLRPPEQSTAPPFTSAVELTGSGTTRQFSLPIFGQAPLGPITITVTAENTGGLKGTATSTFTNLPDAIRNRFIGEGGAATFGALRFGLFLNGCKAAVYEQGAISNDGSAATRLIRGPILTKWLSLKGTFNETGFFGCPLGEERETLVIGGARVQDFERGRIYSSLLGTPSPHTAYVPAVFVDALEKRGGELVHGLPLADPSDSIGPESQTWLFQRFFRPDRTDQLPSTLEIRGTPPTLWMERQLGAWFLGTLEPSKQARDLGRSPATLWESFPCSSNLGPCKVDVEPTFPPPNTPNAGDLFCNGTTYIPALEGSQPPGFSAPIPPEWVGIRGDDVATPVFGAIVSAHMTDIDNGLTHETHNATCPYLHEALGGGLTCVSDYEFFVRPIGPQVDTSPLPSLFGKSNTENIKTEYEVSYAAVAHNFMGAPAVGDLVHTTGRWIIDCGHTTFKSELHPLFSYAKMATLSSEINVSTGIIESLSFLNQGQPATRADIWISGWYPGGEGNAIEFDIFPPPRPSPDARLTIVKPVGQGTESEGGVNVEFSFAPAGAASHVHLKFTAPYRENVVTDAGEMKWEYGRRYIGKWYAYWEE